ncbi:MAG: glycosyltransferase [Planctomycetes bacterium]|nr:glycosyltransferase [Planctomycetota bacterium]MBI3846260.1 glycosyltransferase [Planctomycetota bacterium]
MTPNPPSVLHVLAGYRPQPHGGSVLYPLAMAAAQSRRRRVALFVADVDPLAPPYRARDCGIGGVRARCVAKPGLGRYDSALGVPEEDGALEAPFRDWLARIRPDVVHFHAIVGLAASLPRIARSARCGVVFTVHDLQAVCPTGTMVRKGDVPCPGPEPAACRRCLSGVRYVPVARAALYQKILAAAPSRTGRLVLCAVRAARAPLLRVLARRGPSDPAFVAARHRAVSEAMRCAHRVVAPSRFLADGHASLAIDPTRIVVRPLGISIPAAGGESRPTGGATSSIVFGYIGNVRERKGVHLLVRAFATLPNGSARLVVRGAPDEPYVETLRREWPAGASLGGRYEPADVPLLLREIDVLVLPSIGAEGFPLVVQEAFAHGRPVITSSIGGQSEVVRDGIDGLHFRSGDVEDLARTLRRCIDDRDLLARLRAGIRAPVTIEEDAARLGEIYADVSAEVQGADGMLA